FPYRRRDVGVIPVLGQPAEGAIHEVEGPGAGYVQLETRRGTILDRDVLEDPVLAKMRQRHLHAARVGSHQDLFLLSQQDDIGERLTLRTCDKRLAAAARGQSLDVVSREVVQELGP